MPEGILVLNTSYGIEYINPALEKDFGPVGGRKPVMNIFMTGTEICSLCVTSAVRKGRKDPKGIPLR